MPNNCRLQLPKFGRNDSKLNVFVFWIVDHTNQDIWRRHYGLEQAFFTIFRHFVDETIKQENNPQIYW